MHQRTFGATVCLIQLSGCAWLFQDHLEHGVQPRRRAEPHCSTSSGWAVVDGVFAGLNTLTTVAALSDETLPDRGAYIVFGIAWTVVHVASAMSGSNWAGDCRTAVATWSNREDADADEARPRTRDVVVVREEPTEPVHARPPTPRQPRGFYCADSPSAPTTGFCLREKRDCERTRSIAAGAVPDLIECVLVETAFCVDAGTTDAECSPSAVACEARRSTAGGPSTTSECTETR